MTKKDDKIAKIFMNSSGKHSIISMKSGDNYYLHQSWRKPKVLHKMKGIFIECVCWNEEAEDNSTGEILIGTQNGEIYEALIEPSDEFFKREEKNFQLVHPKR